MSDQVGDAFDLLVDEIGLVLGTLGAEVAEAGEARDFATAARLSQHAQQIEEILDQVRTLESRWGNVQYRRADNDTEDSDGGEHTAAGRRNLGRVARGAKTSEPAFYRPILQILVDRGGAARMSEVLAEIERRMGAEFTEADRHSLPSRDSHVRWRNTAQWARNALVQAGLMERPRRRGVWEISEAGRKWLASGEERL
jgi:hypothetical protein